MSESKLNKNITLKNKLAQKLLEQQKIEIDGIEINLWTGHSKDTVQDQLSWNKIESLTELNTTSDGSSGDIVFTGRMQIPRNEAACYATKLGFKVHSNISKNTDFLVIGSDNVSPTKIAETIELINKGGTIKIIDEITFLEAILEDIVL